MGANKNIKTDDATSLSVLFEKYRVSSGDFVAWAANLTDAPIYQTDVSNHLGGRRITAAFKVAYKCFFMALEMGANESQSNQVAEIYLRRLKVMPQKIKELAASELLR